MFHQSLGTYIVRWACCILNKQTYLATKLAVETEEHNVNNERGINALAVIWNAPGQKKTLQTPTQNFFLTTVRFSNSDNL